MKKSEVEKLSAKEKIYLRKECGRFFLMQEPERYVNHSCDANTLISKKCDVALRDIEKGEEITSNYIKSKALNRFKCKCGSKNCKVKI